MISYININIITSDLSHIVTQYRTPPHHQQRGQSYSLKTPSTLSSLPGNVHGKSMTSC